MGFRFRTSLSLGNRVRLNITKYGLSSVSIGRRGATLNVGGKGVRETVGLPGTGLSYTTEARGGPIVSVITLVGTAIGALISRAVSWLWSP